MKMIGNMHTLLQSFPAAMLESEIFKHDSPQNFRSLMITKHVLTSNARPQTTLKFFSKGGTMAQHAPNEGNYLLKSCKPRGSM